MIQFKSAFPLYVTQDLEAQKTFYSDKFGFESVFFDAEFYLHLIHPTNGVELGFMLPNLSMQPAFLHSTARSDGMVISFEVANAAVAYEQAKLDELDIVFDLKEEPWKQIHFMARDPAGLIIDIVEDSNQAD